MNLTRIPWRYAGYENMNFLSSYMSKLSKVIVWQTEMTEIMYQAATSRVVKMSRIRQVAKYMFGKTKTALESKLWVLRRCLSHIVYDYVI